MTRMKDSGIEWIGEIPEEWGIGNLKYYFDVQLGKMLQPSATSGNDIEIDYLRAINVQWDNISVENLSKMWCNPSEVGKYEIKNGDLLVCEGGEVGRCGIVKHLSDRVIIQNAIHRIRPTEKADVRFLNYYIQHTTKSKWFDILCNKATIAHLTSEKLLNTSVVLPSISEQTQIANFLDKNVAQLDKVKSLLEEQIKTLEDYRQSLIYETVTKGLDKTVPLKDSGVDWIGQIPIASSLKKLKYLLATPLQYGANESGEDYDESLPRYIRITDIDSNGDLKREGKQSLAEKIATPYILQDGDLLFARSGATVGKTFLYKSCFGRSAFAGYLIKASLNKSLVLPKYLYYYTLSPLFNTWKEMTFIQSTIQNIGADRYNILPVLIYPIEEQQKMIDYMDCKISQINQMILIKKEQIENINKQRQTLIYDYVTGKRRV
ncbi:hypothetical protein HO928_08840 [Streptococcus suis]|nr:hypothetical protein [Streptococcus suis]